jgi:hypothetical protein
MGGKMKKICIFILVMVFHLSLYAQNTNHINPRHTIWGMSKNEVLKMEQKNNLKVEYQDTNTLGFITQVSSLDCMIAYNFTDNKLIGVVYMFTVTHSSYSFYIDDYEKIKNSFVEKYGNPDRNKQTWTSESFKDYYNSDNEQRGMAIGMGYLQYATLWRTDDTDLYMQLSGDRLKFKSTVSYLSRKLLPLKLKEEKNKDDGF